MEPVAVVMAALIAGAAAGASAAATSAITDAYASLKSLVVARLRRIGVNETDGEAMITTVSDQVGSAALRQRLGDAGVDAPTLQAAQHLLDLLEQQRGKFVVDASQAKGVLIGDHSVQNNTFQ